MEIAKFAFLTQIDAAFPTTSPIIPQVLITRTGPKPVFVTLIFLPAINKFEIFLSKILMTS